MDWTDPTTSVVPSLDGTVLAVLASTNEPLTGREVHRRARRGGIVGVRNVLSRLAEQGVVRMEVAGAANLYRLNREHIAAPVAASLLDLRPEFLRRLRESIEGWEAQPLAAVLFGSVARGDATAASDVDLLIIRPLAVSDEGELWGAQIAALSESVMAWTGNIASILQVTEPELVDLVRRDHPVLGSLREDAIDLGRRPLRELLPPSVSA